MLRPLLPVLGVSVRPVTLADLRPPRVILREDLRGAPKGAGDSAKLRDRLRNSGHEDEIRGVTLAGTFAETLAEQGLDARRTLTDRALACDRSAGEGVYRADFRIAMIVEQAIWTAIGRRACRMGRGGSTIC